MIETPCTTSSMDSNRIQLVITADCDNIPTSTSSNDECNCFIPVGTEKMIRAQVHALVPESIYRGNTKTERISTRNEPSSGNHPEFKKNVATTQTKETRIISAAELECLCSGKRVKGFPRVSEEQEFIKADSSVNHPNHCNQKSKPKLCAFDETPPKPSSSHPNPSTAKFCEAFAETREVPLERCPCCKCGQKSNTEIQAYPIKQNKTCCRKSNKQKRKKNACVIQ